MKINTYDINYIEKILENNKNKENIEININDNCFLDIGLKEEKVVKSIEIKTSDINNIIQIFNVLCRKGYTIEKIIYDIEDEPYYDRDFSSFESIANNTKLYIQYGDFFRSAPYDEFIGMQETIKWITKVINDTSLSPVEKLMFAYDYMKTFKYKDTSNPYNGADPRIPHRILETGYIICGGYSSLLREIVKNLDVNIKIGEVSIECYDDAGSFMDGHSRNIVKINDDKYDINGIFILDPTWDSIKEYTLPNYNALDLYRYFLIPAEDYKKMFPSDSIPTLFKLYLNVDLDDDEKYDLDDAFDLHIFLNNMEKEKKESKKTLYESALEKLLNEKMKEEEIKKYLSVSRPSLEQFKEMLYNVRLAEGFSKEEAINDVTKVVSFNVDDINEINDEYGLNMSFFEERKTK